MPTKTLTNDELAAKMKKTGSIDECIKIALAELDRERASHASTAAARDRFKKEVATLRGVRTPAEQRKRPPPPSGVR